MANLPPEITQIGVAGVLVLFFIKELFAFLKTKKLNGHFEHQHRERISHLIKINETQEQLLIEFEKLEALIQQQTIILNEINLRWKLTSDFFLLPNKLK